MAAHPEPEQPTSGDAIHQARHAFHDACTNSLEAIITECEALGRQLDAHRDGSQRLPDDALRVLLDRHGDLLGQAKRLHRAFCPDYDDIGPISRQQWWQMQINAAEALPDLLRRGQAADLPLMNWELCDAGGLTGTVSLDMLDDGGDQWSQKVQQAFDAWVDFLGAELKEPFVCEDGLDLCAVSSIRPGSAGGMPVPVVLRAAVARESVES